MEKNFKKCCPSLAKAAWQICAGCSQLGREGQGCFETFYVFHSSLWEELPAGNGCPFDAARVLTGSPVGCPSDRLNPGREQGSWALLSPTGPDRAAVRHSGRPGLEHCLH